MKKYKRSRNLSGKFVILINNKNNENAALLKFVNRRLCEVKAAVVVNRTMLLQTSSRYIINARRNKRLIRRLKVTGSARSFSRFRDQYEQLFKLQKHREELEMRKATAAAAASASASKKITPIKIISCLVCNHKFTTRKYYDEHVLTHKKGNDHSSGSETDLVIDDDVELILDCDGKPPMPIRAAVRNMKMEPVEKRMVNPAEDNSDSGEESLLEEIEEHHVCQHNGCSLRFDTVKELMDHAEVSHKSDDRPFKCNKCNDRFKRESALLTHQKMKHAVPIIEPPIRAPIRDRRKSVFIEKPTSSKPAPLRTRSKSTDKAISFRRFDSATKTNFACRICSVSFGQRNYLDRHMSVFHITKMYLCYKCNTPFDINKFYPHLKEVHQTESGQTSDPQFLGTIKDINSVAVHRCPFCQYYSFTRLNVEDHMKNEHYEKYEKTSSNDEDEMASSPDSLENLVHPDNAQKINDAYKQAPSRKVRKPHNDPSFQYRCGRCLIRYSSSHAVKNHACPKKAVNPVTPEVKPTAKAQGTMRITSNTQLVNGFFRCLSCPQVFTDRNMYNQHTIDEHQDRSTSPFGFYSNLL